MSLNTQNLEIEQSQIENFRSFEHEVRGDILQTSVIIKEIILKVKTILQKVNHYTEEMNLLSKQILLRAYMTDILFNPLKKDEGFGVLTLDGFEGIDLSNIQYGLGTIVGNEFNTDLNEEKHNEIYYYTPIIGIFFKGKPVFLNHNYIEALGGNTVDEIKSEIEKGEVLEKRYTPESAIIAKEAIIKLKAGKGYKNLELNTKDGKKISWNSYGSIKGLEVRIGRDITLGKFQQDIESQENNGLNLETSSLVDNYVNNVSDILDLKDIISLEIFKLISSKLDIIWNNSQLLMNLLVKDDMLFNSNYASALGRSRDEIIEKIKNGTLWNETYDNETINFINGLFKSLETAGYYIDEFPMKSKDGRSGLYSWYRKAIIDKDFQINGSLGIGTSAISDSNATLLGKI